MLTDLVGFEDQKEALLHNTGRFVQGLPANNVLLWGARGTGKSSMIKGVFNHFREQGLRLIEVDRDDLEDLPEIADRIDTLSYRFILFCDDLSFDIAERGYRGLKRILEGSIELPPENLLVYATSNRRHLLPEYQSDNQGAVVKETELHYGDTVEEKLSLSDRFGLWLSFYQGEWEHYLRIIDRLFPDHPDKEGLYREAKAFAMGRASRSGRTARQFFRHTVSGPETP